MRCLLLCHCRQLVCAVRCDAMRLLPPATWMLGSCLSAVICNGQTDCIQRFFLLSSINVNFITLQFSIFGLQNSQYSQEKYSITLRKQVMSNVKSANNARWSCWEVFHQDFPPGGNFVSLNPKCFQECVRFNDTMFWNTQEEGLGWDSTFKLSRSGIFLLWNTYFQYL